MITDWTNEEIEAIMIRLNELKLPFRNHEFSNLGCGMKLLGSGASSNVYDAVERGRKKRHYAIKVLGFDNRNTDPASFSKAVDAQKKLAHTNNSIVKIYDTKDLCVWINGQNEVVNAEVVGPNDDPKTEGDILRLRFILMEKLSPVISFEGRAPRLIPHDLANYDEKEIMKLAYEIGSALEDVHRSGLIHRDIKPENIFYDTRTGRYKLGDFGIAGITDDGMASTVAFSKGYGAPEVAGTYDDRYDCTADIYSLGMMLYVILNEMRFPGSNNYRPSVHQYSAGYVPPEPANGSDELVRVVFKMISYDPDDRYQSMEEVLNELERLKYGRRIKYQLEHRSSALAVGIIFVFMGTALWKLSFMPGWCPELDVWECIFCGLCIWKSALSVFKKNTEPVTALMLGMAVFLMVRSGFVWWKLLLLILPLLFGNLTIGILAGCLLISSFTCLFMRTNGIFSLPEYRWMAVLLLSLSLVLLVVQYVLGERDEKLTVMYLGNNKIWIIASILYAGLLILPRIITVFDAEAAAAIRHIIGDRNIDWILSCNPQRVGLYGLVFCAFWVVREGFLSIFYDETSDNERQGVKSG